jgi:hypothetical protein
VRGLGLDLSLGLRVFLQQHWPFTCVLFVVGFVVSHPSGRCSTSTDMRLASIATVDGTGALGRRASPLAPHACSSRTPFATHCAFCHGRHTSVAVPTPPPTHPSPDARRFSLAHGPSRLLSTFLPSHHHTPPTLSPRVTSSLMCFATWPLPTISWSRFPCAWNPGPGFV